MAVPHRTPSRRGANYVIKAPSRLSTARQSQVRNGFAAATARDAKEASRQNLRFAVSQPADALIHTVRPAAHLRPASWFVRRALIGVFALSVFVLGSAWLLYAGIDPNEAAAADAEHSQSE